MTTLMKTLIAELQAIPEKKQDEVAAFLLADLRAEKRWEELFADSRSQRLLSDMAEKARQEHERGETRPIEELLSS